MIESLVRAHRERYGDVPVPDTAMTFHQLREAFENQMRVRVAEKRVRAIIKDKVEAGEWTAQRKGNTVWYFVNEEAA